MLVLLKYFGPYAQVTLCFHFHFHFDLHFVKCSWSWTLSQCDFRMQRLPLTYTFQSNGLHLCAAEENVMWSKNDQLRLRTSQVNAQFATVVLNPSAATHGSRCHNTRNICLKASVVPQQEFIDFLFCRIARSATVLSAPFLSLVEFIIGLSVMCEV